MEFSAESALQSGKPFSKEFGQAISELRNPIRDLTKRAEKFKKKKSSVKPTRLISSFISQNRERLMEVMRLVNKQALKNEDLAKRAVRESLIQESHVPPKAAEVVSENLVAVAMSDSDKKAIGLLNETLSTTSLSSKDKKDLVNFVEENGRELVPAPEVIEAEYKALEDEVKPEVEYTPPGGPPGGPPRRPRRGSNGGRRERTAGEALRRRRRLPLVAGIFGAAVLGLSFVTGQGKPWEGYPIHWGFDVAGLAGGGALEGSGRLAKGAVGIESVSKRDRETISEHVNDMFSGNYPAEKLLIYFIEVRGDEEDMTKDKNMNSVGDPSLYNSRMKLTMELLDKAAKERNIQPNQLAQKLEAVGQSENVSKFLEEIYQSSKTGKGLTTSQVGEIRNLFQEETGFPWTE